MKPLSRTIVAEVLRVTRRMCADSLTRSLAEPGMHQHQEPGFMLEPGDAGLNIWHEAMCRLGYTGCPTRTVAVTEGDLRFRVEIAWRRSAKLLERLEAARERGSCPATTLDAAISTLREEIVGELTWAIILREVRR